MLCVILPTLCLATQPWNTPLGSFNGVEDYSNGTGTYDSKIHNYIGIVDVGEEWQCVEYVQRYYYTIYGLDLRGLSGGLNAGQFFGNASIMQLTAYANAGATPPQAGDILCFNETGGGLGHVAIIRAVDQAKSIIHVIQQNVKNGGSSPNGYGTDDDWQFAYTVSGGTYTVDVTSAGSSRIGPTFFCQGWLRQVAQQPPSISITSPTTGSSYLTRSSTISLGGTASDNVGVVNVTWSNPQTGGSGTASGTTSWTANNINLATGANAITVTAYDAAGNQSAATLSVTFTPTATSPAGTVVGWGAQVIPYVQPGTRYQAIAAGYDFSLALKSDGTVVAWGDNQNGESMVPGNLTGVMAIAAGDHHSLALKSDGTVVAWGDNNYGESTVPANLAGVIAISAGGCFSLALKSDGTVVAWGEYWNDQSYVPVTVPANLSGVTAIAAGDMYSLALKSDGTVVAWGYNYYGACSVPANLAGVIAIAAGPFHSLALKSDGTVVAWGEYWNDQSYVPVTVPANLSGVTAIAAGDMYSLALKSDGTVVAWGYDYYDVCTVPANLRGVIAIAAGYYPSLALKSDGTVVALGVNILANGTCQQICQASLQSRRDGITVWRSSRTGRSLRGGIILMANAPCRRTSLASSPSRRETTSVWRSSRTGRSWRGEIILMAKARCRPI
jgi:alpha-tubulin suppressor-like RCC1 family protein